MQSPSFLLPLPHLIVGERLGQGGFGSVYRARHEELDVDVAVKVIDTTRTDSAGVENALREARFMARLDHPNLLRIYHAGKTPDFVYLVLELMDGGSCKEMRRILPGLALSLTKQLLSGLQALHDARILHRDVKPANCLYRASDSRVKLADLGIASDWTTMTQTGASSGTLPFMAPELFSSQPRYAPRSDLYALGITLACLVLDSPPYPCGSREELQQWTFSGMRPRISELRPDLPHLLSQIIERLMSPDLSARPKDANSVLAELSAASDSTPTRLTDDNASTITPKGSGGRIGAWELGEVVYSSTNWRGFVVSHIHTGRAARLMHLQPAGPIADHSSAIIQAAERASSFGCPQIVQVIDWGSEAERAYVVTAAQGQTFEKLFAGDRVIDEVTAIQFMYNLASGLIYLHESGFVYQLIDPGSLVMSGDARSAMFGWPLFCVPTGSPGYGEDSQRVLVQLYAAPEILGAYAPTIEAAVDIFGLGITFIRLLVGGTAYEEAFRTGGIPLLLDGRATITRPFARLLERMTCNEPEQRPGASIVLDELLRIGRNLSIYFESSD